ncbi:MAG: type II toxin-antitoxin system VapC family toxin [Opitutales bacterium]|nr:type II toxin-antitoxin system VapC family toxin [Opitutales bacterium]
MTPTVVNGWLLDTHAMLWILYGDSRLSAAATADIEGELPVYYSTVSFLEVALKRSAKGFDFFIEDDWDLLLPRELKRVGVIRLDLESTDCRKLEDLPLHHRDPFDRVLIAQAMQRRLGILSKDGVFDTYDVLRHW